MIRFRATATQDVKGGRVGERIERIRHNAPRILIRKPPFRLVFHHMPKCGGTSVNLALRRCLPLDRRVQVEIRPEAATKAAKISGRSAYAVREEMLLYSMGLPRMAYIWGNIPFSERAYKEYGTRWSFVTVLRHPVSRWLSYYYYNRYGQKSRFAQVSKSLEEYLASPEGVQRGSAYVRFFGGRPDEPPDVGRAVDMIENFSVVGALEDLDGFAKAFRERFGTEIRIPHLNATPAPASVRAREITPVAMTKVEEICEPDLAFYKAVFSNQVPI